MKKALIAVLAVVTIGLLGASYYAASQNDTGGSQTQTTQQTEQTTNDRISFSEDGKTVTYAGEEGVTALATLESLTDVTAQESDFGSFVTGINGVEADSDTEFWAFYVNGQMADEGAGTYIAKAGDKFEWRLEKLQQ